MKYLIILNLLLLVFHFSSAQNIFELNGFDKAPLSLSNGQYNEFFNNDEVVQIGSVLLNTQTNKVVAFVEEDTTQVKYLSDLNTRWLSIDPLAAKYPQISPYVYCANNPIIIIDPDGRKLVVVSAGCENLSSKYQATVSQAFNNKVIANVDEKSGNVSFSVKDGCELDKYEQSAFNSLKTVEESDLTVKQTLYDHNTKGSEFVNVGRYQDGSIDLDDIASFGNDNKRITSKGALVHESIEQLDKMKRNADKKDVSGNNGFIFSHNKAIIAENETSEYKRSEIGNDGYVNDKTNNKTVWFEHSFIKDKKGNIIGERYTRVE